MSPTTQLLDPATGLPFAEVPLARETEVDAAVRAAATAFGTWRRTTPAERGLALLRIAQALEDRADEFADLECANTGKPRRSAVADEIEPAVDQLRFFAGAARLPEGKAAGEYLAGHTSSVRREPIGVCAQLLPWNYPLQMAVWKFAPAIAAGNTVVLKPAETTPLTAVRLAEIAAPFLPPGVLTVLCGDRETGRLLAAHPDVAHISLTGSTRAGRELATAAGASLKRLHLELGGNAPVLVFPDTDVTAAAAGIAEAAFFNAGQDCVAAARVLAHEDIADELVEALVKQAHLTRTGPPDDENAFYGPLNNADQLARLTGLVDRLPAHAVVRTGGTRVGDRGYFFAPTVITGVRQDDEIVQEELFGPVLTVQSFTTEEEAVRLANGVPQGLAASVWTRDHARANSITAELDFGCVWINTHLRFAAEMPHGGFKASGYGKDLSAYAVEEYTRIKHVMSAH
ncbi:aminobutyraldehyde dehydrogenase [Lentzea sp. NPDC004782]|uniref:aminobutyraldehyde dehydrogenase n=1 Tax=Lentzea sp. NPDC004782 TaxID=3154458 RepID=UPI0033BEF398